MSELVWGIKNGDIDQVKDIIENKKIDVNALLDGRVPLHYAADYGQTAVLNYLLDKGADPNFVGKIAGEIMRHKFRGIPHLLTLQGRQHIGELLVAYVHGPVSTFHQMVDKHGISVILAAIWEGHTDCVKTLLKHGASKDGKTPDGTPYIEAAEKDEIKELLT